MSDQKLKITQVRSRIGRPQKHRRILDALGLKKTAHSKQVGRSVKRLDHNGIAGSGRDSRFARRLNHRIGGLDLDRRYV